MLDSTEPNAAAIASDPDLAFMNYVLNLARQAGSAGEIPVAAILVLDNKIIAEATNWREHSPNPVGHAEVLCLQAAGQNTGQRFFPQASLYCSLEPCLMCLGAIIQARVGRLVYAAKDHKGGACYLLDDPDLPVNHRPLVKCGILAEESSALLKSFFHQRRKQIKQLGGRGKRRSIYEQGTSKIELVACPLASSLEQAIYSLDGDKLVKLESENSED